MMNSNNFTVDPLWVSSEEHLYQYKSIFDNTPWFKRWFGVVNVPPSFPQVQIQSRIYPVVYYSTGLMEIDGALLHYSAQRKSGPFGNTYRNIDDTLHFEFNVREVVNLRRLKPEVAFFNYYNIEWIGLDLRNFDKPLLICVGDLGPSMKRIQAETTKLFDLLVKLKSNSG